MGSAWAGSFGRGERCTAAVAVIDLALIRKRLTPGFERRLTRGSLWLVYGAFAMGIFAGSYACRR